MLGMSSKKGLTILHYTKCPSSLGLPHLQRGSMSVQIYRGTSQNLHVLTFPPVVCVVFGGIVGARVVSSVLLGLNVRSRGASAILI